MLNTADFSYQFYRTSQEAWDATYEAILAAKKSIYWEIFIFIDDAVGTKFIEALAAKAKSGVTVKVIFDAIGSYNFSKVAEKYFKDAGVEMLWYNRLYPEIKISSWLARLLNRNHRKVLIVDEETVFLGGVNVQASFKNWDDLYLKIVGPVARPLLRGFAKSYVSAGGKKENVRQLLHPKWQAWKTEWKTKLNFIVHSRKFATVSKMRQIYIRGLAMAERSVNLITPYYVPDKKFLRAVVLARKRGVKVNLFLPLRTDVKIMEVLARTYYDLTAKAGVNIYFLPNMNHGKAMSVDDKFGVVGSVNVTRRGGRYDEEASVEFSDEHMVKDLNTIFNDWKTTSQAFVAGTGARRPWRDRLQEWLAKKLENFV